LARLLRQRAGLGGNHEYSAVILETDLDLATIGAHYTVQLEEAGWSRMDGGQAGPQTWSIWTFADTESGPWTGVFSALRIFETPQRYHLQVHINRLPDHS
jgi:hypothetical protein